MVSIFLARVIGIYLVIVSIAMLARRQKFVDVLANLENNPAVLSLAGFVVIILGILLVVSHNLWVADWRIIITFVAWITLLKGLIRLFFPEVTKKSVRWWIEHPKYLPIGGVISLLIGIYLLYVSF